MSRWNDGLEQLQGGPDAIGPHRGNRMGRRDDTNGP